MNDNELARQKRIQHKLIEAAQDAPKDSDLWIGIYNQLNTATIEPSKELKTGRIYWPKIVKLGLGLAAGLAIAFVGFSFLLSQPRGVTIPVLQTANGQMINSTGDIDLNWSVAPTQPANMDFEQDLAGWYLAGSQPQNYEVGLDRQIRHEGTYSAYLKSKTVSSSGFGTLMRNFQADEYAGGKLRLSGYVRADAVEGWAGLWLRIDGADKQVLNFNNMQSRPITGTSDWQKYDIVLNVPKESVGIAFGVLLTGKGQIWVDDLEFESVGQNAPVTDQLNGLAQNLDFENGTTGWNLFGAARPKDYELGIAHTVKYSGQASAYVKAVTNQPAGFSDLAQGIAADQYRGKRLRFSAYGKSEAIEGWAGFWMRVDGPDNKVTDLDNMEGRPIRGTTDWKKYELVLDVPSDSVRIYFGIILYGKGQVWLDDLQLDTVGQNVLTTEWAGFGKQGQNLSFEEGLKYWVLSGNNPENYEQGISSDVKYQGKAGAYFKSSPAATSEQFAALTQRFKADDYRGKRVRISAMLKTEAVQTEADLWLRVQGLNLQVLTSIGLPSLITGTNDWKKYEVVLDVPENAQGLVFAVSLQGQGQVWIDAFQIEAVDKAVPTTSSR